MTKSFSTQILEQETSTFKYLKSYEKKNHTTIKENYMMSITSRKVLKFPLN
jgi:hypothetical protein